MRGKHWSVFSLWMREFLEWGQERESIMQGEGNEPPENHISLWSLRHMSVKFWIRGECYYQTIAPHSTVYTGQRFVFSELSLKQEKSLIEHTVLNKSDCLLEDILKRIIYDVLIHMYQLSQNILNHFVNFLPCHRKHDKASLET